MSLTQKLKQSGTALTLAGSLLLGGSGCTPLSVLGGALIVAQSNRDAARIQAEANESRVVYVPVQQPSYVQQKVPRQQAIIAKQNRFFAAEKYNGELNGNDMPDFEEYSGITRE